jgi:hypothetical protein
MATRKVFSTRQKIIFSFISFLFFLTVIIIIGEITARAYAVTLPELPPPWNTTFIDKKFGWLPKANYVFEGQMKDAANVQHTVHLRTDSRGFKAFTPKDSLKHAPNVLFLGDSYVQAVEVSNEETFYAQMAKQYQMNIFAFGASGWGNYQEYLLLDKYLEEIKPDIIVWEICANDVIDDYEKLELEALYQVKLRRPYVDLEGDEYFAYPIPLSAKMCEYSKLFEAIYKFFVKTEMKIAPENSAEAKMGTMGRKYPYYDHSLKVMQKIFEKAKQRIGNQTKLYVVHVSHTEPFESDYKEIFTQLKIPYIAEVSVALDKAKNEGKVIHSIDGWHWSVLGHQIVAETIGQRLEKDALLLPIAR